MQGLLASNITLAIPRQATTKVYQLNSIDVSMTIQAIPPIPQCPGLATCGSWTAITTLFPNTVTSCPSAKLVFLPCPDPVSSTSGTSSSSPPYMGDPNNPFDGGLSSLLQAPKTLDPASVYKPMAIGQVILLIILMIYLIYFLYRFHKRRGFLRSN